MKDIVVFGLGNNWRMYQDVIKEKFSIVGYIDNNWEKIEGEASPVENVGYMKFDWIVIMPDVYEDMVQQLHNKGIADEKIILLKELQESNLHYRRKTIGQTCFGQHFEDLIVAAIFGQIGIRKPTYMDLGANHPYEMSNTALFYLKGCRGINIEANPLLINRLKQERPEDINLNVGVSTKEGMLPFYKIDGKDGLNTFSKKEADKCCSDEFNLFLKEIVELPVVTLDFIIEKYCQNVFPDFLDCDIEGLDYDVLQAYDLKKNGPKVICVEVRAEKMRMFDKMLSDKGYFKFCRMGENNIYVQNKYSGRLIHAVV